MKQLNSPSLGKKIKEIYTTKDVIMLTGNKRETSQKKTGSPVCQTIETIVIFFLLC